jgi:hypothetical protein
LPIATLDRARHSHPLLPLADHLIFEIVALRELPALVGRTRS